MNRGMDWEGKGRDKRKEGDQEGERRSERDGQVEQKERER